MHLLRPAPADAGPGEPGPRPHAAHLRHPQPLPLQQRALDGGAPLPRRRPRRACGGRAPGAGGKAARRGAHPRRGVSRAGLQPGDEPGRGRRRGHRRASALARGSALERRHQLHARARRHQGDDRAPARELGPAAPGLRPRILRGTAMVKEQVAQLLQDALQRSVRDGLLPPGDYPVQLDAPRQAAHGDFACNAAMVYAKQHAAATGAQKPNPRALAQAIVDRVQDPDGILAGKPEIAGPGFLNLKLAQDVWHKALKAVWTQREKFGRSDAGKGLRTMVEFVSANPTGPMHVGHGRGAVIGDVVANLLEWAGYDVFREFYINDAGGQVWRLAHAVLARASELRPSGPRVPLDPEDYQGEYIKDVSRAWLEAGGDPSRPFEEIREPLRQFATRYILDNLIRKDLELFGIRFDSFFSEKQR